MPLIEVVLYEKENGEVPVNEFLSSMSKKMRAKVLWAISVLEENGYALRKLLSAPLGDGIFELRVQVATDISRVLYFFVMNEKAVLTHGFVKKTQKTPKSEIDKAKRYREDYLRRFSDDKVS